jgi:hypothetical protein
LRFKSPVPIKIWNGILDGTKISIILSNTY